MKAPVVKSEVVSSPGFFSRLFSSSTQAQEQKWFNQAKLSLQDAYAAYLAAGTSNLEGLEGGLPFLMDLVDSLYQANSKNELMFYMTLLEQILGLLSARPGDTLGVDSLASQFRAAIKHFSTNGKRTAFETFQKTVGPLLSRFKENLNELQKKLDKERKACPEKSIVLMSQIELSQHKLDQLVAAVNRMQKALEKEEDVVKKIETGLDHLYRISLIGLTHPDVQAEFKVQQINHLALTACRRALSELFDLRYDQLPALGDSQKEVLTGTGAVLGVVGGPLGELGRGVGLAATVADGTFSTAVNVNEVAPYVKKNPLIGVGLAVGTGSVVTCAVLFPPSIPIFLAILQAWGMKGLSQDLVSNLMDLKGSVGKMHNLEKLAEIITPFFKALKADSELKAEDWLDSKSCARLLTVQPLLDEKTAALIQKSREILHASLKKAGLNATIFDQTLFKGDRIGRLYFVLAALAAAHKSPQALADFLVAAIEATPEVRAEKMLRPLLVDKVDESFIKHFITRFEQAIRVINYKEPIVLSQLCPTLG
jgi:hypothetical protein